MPHTPRGQRKRCRRYDDPWHVHCLTFSCFRRQPLFSGRLAPRWFLENLDAARRVEPFDLWAFVVMPEHVHLVIAPGRDYQISRILWRIKKPFADRILAHVRAVHADFLPRLAERRPDGRVAHRFWQPGGGYDRNLWTPKRIHEKIRYVHENPVRRGLVDRPEDWPWTSYRTWCSGQPDPLRLDLGDVPTRVTSE